MTIDVDKLYSVFLNPEHKVSPENIDWFVERVRAVVTKSFSESGKAKPPRLRASVIGKKDKQLYFEFNQNKYEGLEGSLVQIEHGNEVDDVAANFLTGADYFKFLYGDVIEAILVLLMKEAGYECDTSDDEIKLNGVTGHKDVVVTHPDKTTEVVDTKSASRFAFEPKFVKGELLEGNDAFGYIGQNSLYRQALNADKSGWLAANKDTGEIAYLALPRDKEIDAHARIDHLKKILRAPEPPSEDCYPEETDKLGNSYLGSDCRYCPFKFACKASSNNGKGLRAVKVNKKWVYYTNLIKEPKGASEAYFD